MGCCGSKEKDVASLDQADGKGDFIAKQNVIVWEYHNDGPPDGKMVAKDAKLEVKSLNNFPFLLTSVFRTKERGGR